MDSAGEGRWRQRRLRSRSPSAPQIHPTSQSVARATGLHERFFYVHIRGTIRFHFFDLHVDGQVNLFGGSYANGPISSSGWHGGWEVIESFHGNDSYIAAMRLRFSYMGSLACEYHMIYAAQSRFNPDCWVLYEGGTPHAIMYRLPAPEGPQPWQQIQ